MILGIFHVGLEDFGYGVLELAGRHPEENCRRFLRSLWTVE
jgi:hypothetical protein